MEQSLNQSVVETAVVAFVVAWMERSEAEREMFARRWTTPTHSTQEQITALEPVGSGMFLIHRTTVLEDKEVDR